jgi:hypothetical protein
LKDKQPRVELATPTFCSTFFFECGHLKNPIN